MQGQITLDSTVFNVATNNSPWDGEFTMGTMTADDGIDDNGEYVLFSGVTGTEFTVTAQYLPGSVEIGVTGVQVVGVIPEPSSVGLLSVGAIAMLIRRRRTT